MTAPVVLAKAEMQQIDADLKNVVPGHTVKLQFNPDSLKVSFANQLQTPTGAASRQFVGAGTTKLSLTLVFDVNSTDSGGVDDVRKLTEKVAYFITPQEEGKNFIPPNVRFLWGSFQFDGTMDSMEENLEFFSSEGKPLRATVAVAMSKQRITKFEFAKTGGGGAAGLASAPGAPPAPGTNPLAQVSAGATVQGLAAQAGLADKWQDIATANGIENPRHLVPGQLINLNATLRRE